MNNMTQRRIADEVRKDELEEGLAGPGHNMPPPTDPAEVLGERLVATHKSLLARRAELQEALGRLPVTCETAEQAQKLTSFIVQLSDCGKRLEAARVEEKKPYDALASSVHAFFKDRLQPLELGIARVKTLLLAYQRQQEALAREVADKERQRQAELAATERATADKLAQEAVELEAAGMRHAAERKLEQAATVEQQSLATSAAASAPVLLAKTVLRGAIGGAASTSSRWAVRITDIDTLDIKTLVPFIDREALEKAARAWMKLKTKPLKAEDKPPELAGLEVYRDTTLNVRG